MNLDELELELRKLPGVRSVGFDQRDDLVLVQVHVVSAIAADTPLPIAATRIAARHSDRPVAVEIVRSMDAPTGAAALRPVPEPEAAIDLTTAEVAGGEPEREEAAEARTPPAAAAIAAEPAPATTPAPEPTIEPPAAAAGESARRDRPRLLAVLAFPDTGEVEVHVVHRQRRTIGRADASLGLIAAVEATIGALTDLGYTLPTTLQWVRPVDGQGSQPLIAVALSDDASRTLYGFASGAGEMEAAARATLDALNRVLEREISPLA